VVHAARQMREIEVEDVNGYALCFGMDAS